MGIWIKHQRWRMLEVQPIAPERWYSSENEASRKQACLFQDSVERAMSRATVHYKYKNVFNQKCQFQKNN